MMNAQNQSKCDAFLSHNSQDKPAVMELASRLESEAGLKVWLDKRNSVPGENAIEELETAIGQSRACVVFLGPSGVGSWHKAEIQAALRKNIHNKSYRVVPVLLPETPTPTGNDFLLNFGWVDFRANGLHDDNEFRRLVDGITGASTESGSIATINPDSNFGVFRLRHRWWILLVAVLVLASVAMFYQRTKLPNPPEPIPAMVVIVDNALGQPAIGAQVEIDALPGQTFTTNSDGAVSIPNIPRQSGDKIRIKASNGQTMTDVYLPFPNPNSEHIVLR